MFGLFSVGGVFMSLKEEGGLCTALGRGVTASGLGWWWGGGGGGHCIRARVVHVTASRGEGRGGHWAWWCMSSLHGGGSLS